MLQLNYSPTMNSDKTKVAMVSRQDFERIKRKSAQLPTRKSVEIDKKNDHPPFAPVPRKVLPKTVKLTEKDQEIITRAELAKQEELEEVRRANRILLTAKCNLIRKEQIAEKDELGREHNHEEMRYYQLMERDRQEELLRVARENEERQMLNKQHAESIRKQLEMRANERQKQADIIKAEADALAILEARLKASNEKAAKEKEVRRDKIKKDLQYAYDMNNKIKMSTFEKERHAEMKVQEYMRQRRAREEAQELEKRNKHEQRERQMLRMCQDQMQISNSRDDKYEKWLHREAERKDREFRQKELEAALIRKKEFDVIMKDREMQQTEKRRLQELERLREQREYEVNLGILQKDLEKERLSDCSKQKQREYRDLIKDQMQVNEQKRKMARIKSKQDLEELQRKEKLRQETIDRVLADKIKELQLSRVPDNLIKDVERRIKRVA